MKQRIQIKSLLREMCIGLILIATLPDVFAQVPCADSLINARTSFNRGLLDQTINTLSSCREVESGLDVPQLREILLTLANAYLYKNDLDSTDMMIRYLMRRVDRNYRSDKSTDPIVVQNMVRKHRIKWWEKRWVQVGSGVLIGGIASYFIFRPRPEVLPTHPVLPDPPR